MSTADTEESQFVLRTVTGSGVSTLDGERVVAGIRDSGSAKKGYKRISCSVLRQSRVVTLTERVQVECPESVQVGWLALVIEVNVVTSAAVLHTPSFIDITIPSGGVPKNKSNCCNERSLDVSSPKRAATSLNVQMPCTPLWLLHSQAPRMSSRLQGAYTLVREIALVATSDKFILQRLRSWIGMVR